MLSKKQVLQTVKDLPDQFSASELIDHILLLQKVKQAQQEIKEGKGLSTAETEKRLKKWLRPSI